MDDTAGMPAKDQQGGATMSGMTTHKRTFRHAASGAVPRNHDRAAAWLVLIFAGGTQVSFNIWHAIHSGMPLWLAILYGLAPVALAMGMSHVVAAYQGGWFMKAVTFAVMVGAMILSVRATGVVVEPATGAIWWLFGAVVDTAALVALQVVLSPESRAAAKAARQAAKEAVWEAAAKAVPQAVTEAIGEPAEVPSLMPAGEPVPVPAGEPSQVSRPRAVRVVKSPEAERGRAEYRKSLRQGQPLSDRALGAKFGKSRTWGASRIREVDEGPALTAQVPVGERMRA